MSARVIYSEDGQQHNPVTKDHEKISSALARLGVRFEQWPANMSLSVSAESEEVLAAYKDEVERLNK